MSPAEWIALAASAIALAAILVSRVPTSAQRNEQTARDKAQAEKEQVAATASATARAGLEATVKAGLEAVSVSIASMGDRLSGQIADLRTQVGELKSDRKEHLEFINELRERVGSLEERVREIGKVHDQCHPGNAKTREDIVRLEGEVCAVRQRLDDMIDKK